LHIINYGMAKSGKKLGVLAATSISGNDISSSVLYVSALAISFAGWYAWITLLVVAFVLYLFRKIYGEVVGALPLNGGAYNALLNTTNKSVASLAASLTLLSYMATAVISANEAMHYLSQLFSSLPVRLATIGLLVVFAVLAINGIRESSKVAIGIFIFHLVSLVLLSSFIGFYLIEHGMDTFFANRNVPLKYPLYTALLFGFAASMLGISGFESSANFVEEQAKGVFPKTLKNMWIVVSIINPLMAFLALSIFPISDIIQPSHQTALLSHMGELAAGEWLAIWVSIDAFLVLSGAVLTSYIGVSGLLERMTLDRILPQGLLKKNKKGAAYRIVIVFLILSISVLLITKGDVTLLAGVYTLSFLSVMSLFGLGNILLKVKRAKLPRPEHAPWFGLLIAILGVTIAFSGNVMMPSKNIDSASNLRIFMEYFIPTMLFVMVMLNRTLLLKLLLNVIRAIFDPIRRFTLRLNKNISATIEFINSQEFVFFTKDDDVAVLNKVMLYIRNNEHTSRLKIVKCVQAESEISDDFRRDIDVLDREYPEIDIDFVCIEGKFGPELIEQLSVQWNIPINFMFIGSPGDRFPYRLEELGGVRLII
jgi:amino acid transporter